MMGQAATDMRTKIRQTKEALNSMMRSRDFAIRNMGIAHDQFTKGDEEKIIEAIQTNKKANEYVDAMKENVYYIEEIGIDDADIKKILDEIKKQLTEAEKKISNTEGSLLTKELGKAEKSNKAASDALKPIMEMVKGIRSRL